MKATTLLALAAVTLASRDAAAQQQASLTFAGTVVDSVKQPLRDAVVLLPALDRTATTNDKGAFRIENLPAGTHRVSVRRIGFTQMDTAITLREGQNIEWRVALGPGKLVVLDSVVVTAPEDPRMAEFEANMKRGFGRFLTRTDLAKKESATLPTVLRTLSGASIMTSNGGMNFITSKRVPPSGCITPRPAGPYPRDAYAAQEAEDDCLRRERIFYVPDVAEKGLGVRRACYPMVYVDQTLMNVGRPTPPYDLSSYPVDKVEAIEWYEGPSQTPQKYNIQRAECGVLVIHARRTKKP